MNQLIRKQRLPISLEEAWEFFSSPKNLEKITPGDMKFVITNDPPEKMHAGMVITYKVTPLLNIPLSWMTEITQVKEPFFFIDDQRSGPFKVWHHQHHFREIEGGVEMTDIVTYAAPFGILGRFAEKLVVDRKVRGIFDFRFKLLEEKFGKL
jgi:ligand-binding SRPBCC domain-containing protein